MKHRYVIVKYKECEITTVTGGFQNRYHAVSKLWEIAANYRGYQTIQGWKDDDDMGNVAYTQIEQDGEWTEFENHEPIIWKIIDCAFQ